ncbi:BTAD domain-containing putative transcriptional regulator, partial [Nocardiopsis sp. NPDC006938]|uniref:AfsR/SARP family transcriptional regulator n=1 Tax=Nocardiopsis sp. NPDC006938 TaxID=3364337 RepID=UPI0036B9F560
MRFGVLGPLTVWDHDGRPLRVAEAKVRALLADLLVHRGRPVPVDRLVDDLWGERLPDDPAGALQGKVSRLRRALGDPAAVAFGPAGYLLRLGSDDVDADRFGARVEVARTLADRERAEALADALALWRGEAFAGFGDAGFAVSEVRRLGRVLWMLSPTGGGAASTASGRQAISRKTMS